jgi:formylmethanofuran dehydrogenase subunit E
MREAFFILFVIVVLLALTAVRYRKQIANVIGVARMLKDVKDQATTSTTLKGEQPSVQLVSCAKCGVWVPQTKALTKSGKVYCSNDCAFAIVT